MPITPIFTVLAARSVAAARVAGAALSSRWPRILAGVARAAGRAGDELRAGWRRCRGRSPRRSGPASSSGPITSRLMWLDCRSVSAPPTPSPVSMRSLAFSCDAMRGARRRRPSFEPTPHVVERSCTRRPRCPRPRASCGSEDHDREARGPPRTVELLIELQHLLGREDAGRVDDVAVQRRRLEGVRA